ncbi:hypothetical protein H8959_003945, partial [Pygathrix nigripes]
FQDLKLREFYCEGNPLFLQQPVISTQRENVWSLQEITSRFVMNQLAENNPILMDGIKRYPQVRSMISQGKTCNMWAALYNCMAGLCSICFSTKGKTKGEVGSLGRDKVLFLHMVKYETPAKFGSLSNPEAIDSYLVCRAYWEVLDSLLAKLQPNTSNSSQNLFGTECASGALLNMSPGIPQLMSKITP